MIYREIPLTQNGSGPDAKLTLYLQAHSESLQIRERPLVLLCPGGGYEHVSEREGESEAFQFLAMGCHAALLHYSVAPARYPVQLTELAYAVKYIREHTEEWHIDPGRIVVQGSSAGGHLAACLGMFWTEEWLREAVGLPAADAIRPDALLLCYPVITAGEFAHKGSFENLTGGDETLNEKLSLEKRVGAHTPPVFLWHTYEDGSVPVENSLLLVSALRRQGIPTEFHLYPKGRHGLALAGPLTADKEGGHVQEECTSWIRLAHTWLMNL